MSTSDASFKLYFFNISEVCCFTALPTRVFVMPVCPAFISSRLVSLNVYSFIYADMSVFSVLIFKIGPTVTAARIIDKTVHTAVLVFDCGRRF